MIDTQKLIVNNPFTNNKVGEIMLKSKSEISFILEKAYNAKYELTSKERSIILNKAAKIYGKNKYENK